MTYFEDKDPDTGKAIKHREVALKAAQKKRAGGISNAEVKQSDEKRYKELCELHDIEKKDIKLIEAEVDAAITEIVNRDWGEGILVTEYAFDNEEEWLIFDDEYTAIEAAINRVEEDVKDNPELFPDWILFDSINEENAKWRFMEMYNKMNRGYVDGIEDEDNDEFRNRLASEMHERDLITYEEATDEDFDLEDKKEEMVEAMTQESIDEGNYGFDYYRDNFGTEAASKLLKEWCLVDTREVAKYVVGEDGAANTLSGYDGLQVDLDNGMVMYRTN